jgi:rubredoxin
MELLPFSHALIDNFKCPKCGTKNSARIKYFPGSVRDDESLRVECRACEYCVRTKTKDAE